MAGESDETRPFAPGQTDRRLARHERPTNTPRPAPKSRGPQRYLRSVAGIYEEVLDWAPEERPRYTRLGAIIVNTGLLAGISLFAALHHVVAAPAIILLLIGAFWAYLVINFDGWLIASTHGVLGKSKVAVFLPRFFISLLLGAVIAEPLVLWVFQPAIQANIRTFRSAQLVHYESDLWRCNPVTGIPVSDPSCQSLGLSIAESPDSKRRKLADLQGQRTMLKQQVDETNAELNRLNEIARAECNGTVRPGLSGRVGEGPNCRRNRAEADQYRRDSQLAQRQADLTSLDNQITTLAAEIETSSRTYAQLIDTAIKTKVAERRADQGQGTGLLDEVAALGRLSKDSWFVFAAQWLLRLLLIALDCMPVLTKLMGGTTRYDRFIHAQLEMAQRMHTESIAFQERTFRQATRADIERLDQEDRDERSRRQAAERNEIDRLIRQLREDRRLNLTDPPTIVKQRVDEPIDAGATRTNGSHWRSRSTRSSAEAGDAV
jgi:cell division protein FtsB